MDRVPSNLNYVVEKVLNHNTVLCKADKEGEMFIFFGKGIGFNKKSGEIFDINQGIESNMMVLNGTQTKQYRVLMDQLSRDNLAEIVQSICLDASNYFEGSLNSQLQISLLDHLNFAIDRQKYGIDMNFPFLNDINNLYPKEYDFAVRALQTINSSLDFELPQSELGFLVLHFHAAITNQKVSSIILQKQIFFEMLEIIEGDFGEKIDTNSLYYNRLLVHIDYAIKRSNQNIQIKNVLLESIKDHASADFSLSCKLQKYLKEKYKIDLNEDEVGYLALHLHNLRHKQSYRNETGG